MGKLVIRTARELKLYFEGDAPPVFPVQKKWSEMASEDLVDIHFMKKNRVDQDGNPITTNRAMSLSGAEVMDAFEEGYATLYGADTSSFSNPLDSFNL